jgi:hypothetical protein
MFRRFTAFVIALMVGWSSFGNQLAMQVAHELTVEQLMAASPDEPGALGGGVDDQSNPFTHPLLASLEVHTNLLPLAPTSAGLQYAERNLPSPYMDGLQRPPRDGGFAA